MKNNFSSLINREIEDHFSVLKDTKSELKNKVLKIVDLIKKTLDDNKKILVIGNGGSAADSIHLSAELAGKFKSKKRAPLKCISLAENISTLTAIGNDFNFESIFSRQVEAIGESNDLLIGISTSGKSKNIKKAFQQAKRQNIRIIGLFGKNITSLMNLCNVSISIQSKDTARIQEMHILTIHLICQILDEIY
jgi:D-sedoheptulose 7-phosphate isomerase